MTSSKGSPAPRRGEGRGEGAPHPTLTPHGGERAFPFLGATHRHDGKTEFLVWAPKASRVELRLLNPDRILPMEKADRGYFHLNVGDAPPGTLYFFRLDGDKERPDPASRSQPQGVHGPSAVADPDFPWTDESWD